MPTDTEETAALAFVTAIESEMIALLERATRRLSEAGEVRFSRHVALHATGDVLGRLILSVIAVEGDRGRAASQQLVDHLQGLLRDDRPRAPEPHEVARTQVSDDEAFAVQLTSVIATEVLRAVITDVQHVIAQAPALQAEAPRFQKYLSAHAVAAVLESLVTDVLRDHDQARAHTFCRALLARLEVLILPPSSSGVH